MEIYLLKLQWLARLRAGLLDLGHVNYAQTQAKVQCCIGCNKPYYVSLLWPHVFLSCELFTHTCGLLADSLKRDVQVTDVWLGSDSEEFLSLLDFAGAIHNWHYRFWKC